MTRLLRFSWHNHSFVKEGTVFCVFDCNWKASRVSFGHFEVETALETLVADCQHNWRIRKTSRTRLGTIVSKITCRRLNKWTKCVWYGLQPPHRKPSRRLVNNTFPSTGNANLHYFFLLLTGHLTNSILCLNFAEVEEVFLVLLLLSTTHFNLVWALQINR